MIYYLTAGVLCAADEAQPLASIRGCLCGAEKQVFDRDNAFCSARISAFWVRTPRLYPPRSM